VDACYRKVTQVSPIVTDSITGSADRFEASDKRAEFSREPKRHFARAKPSAATSQFDSATNGTIIFSRLREMDRNETGSPHLRDEEPARAIRIDDGFNRNDTPPPLVAMGSSELADACAANRGSRLAGPYGENPRRNLACTRSAATPRGSAW
jgi:hypothetical protein